ncbi:MAG: hypothetical protein H7Z41_17080 [Cytophagales bacterium]|nr:hypothetical protein [Armatimonadota bacterium]
MLPLPPLRFLHRFEQAMMPPPPKALFTQAAAILLSRTPSEEEVLQALLLASPIEARSTTGGRNWCEGQALLVLPFLPERNGYVLVDIVDRPWPDALGESEEPEIVGAWNAGHFGPLSESGGLRRAATQSWKWKSGRRAPALHVAFLRIRLTYQLGVSAGITRMPPGGVSPQEELLFLTQIAGALLSLRGALCVFFPAGEALRDAAFVEERLNLHRAGGPLPLDIWANIRFLPLNDPATWVVMDTVGMPQLDLPDLEAAFPLDKNERYPPHDVEAFLRNLSLRLLRDGDASVAGPSSLPGPGGALWRSAGTLASGFSAPHRRVVRFLPRTLGRPPQQLRSPYPPGHGK